MAACQRCARRRRSQLNCRSSIDDFQPVKSTDGIARDEAAIQQASKA